MTITEQDILLLIAEIAYTGLLRDTAQDYNERVAQIADRLESLSATVQAERQSRRESWESFRQAWEQAQKKARQRLGGQ
jgi:galactokinase